MSALGRKKWHRDKIAGVASGGQARAVEQRLLRLPFPREALRFGHLVGRHKLRDIVAVLYRIISVLTRRRARGGQVVPNMSLDIVLGDALAVLVHNAKVILSTGMSQARSKN